jgi:hypothetical protein
MHPEVNGPEDAVTPSTFSSDRRAVEETIKLVAPYLGQNYLNDSQAALIGRALWANLRQEERKRRAKMFTIGDSVRYARYGEWRTGVVEGLQIGGIIVEIRDSENQKIVLRNVNFHEVRHA